MLSVIVASTDATFRDGLSVALSARPDVSECRPVEIAEAVRSVSEDESDQVVVLHGAPTEPDLVIELASKCPVLVLGSGGPADMITAVEAGAMGYLDATAPLEDIAVAVRSLGKGVATVDPSLLGALLRHVVERRRVQAEARQVLDVLTPREDEVFRLLAVGLDNNQVADRLFISVQTVRTHTRRIMDKLDLHSRHELLALAVKCGLDLDTGDYQT